MDDEPHLRVNGAEHLEIARRREGNVSPGARLLVPGVEREFRRIDVGMMQKVAVVVHDLQRFAALDADFAGMELPSLLRNRVGGNASPTSVPAAITTAAAASTAKGRRTRRIAWLKVINTFFACPVAVARPAGRQSALQTKAGQVRFTKVEGLS